VSVDVYVLQPQLVAGTMKNDGIKHRMDIGNETTMMDSCRW